MKPTPLTSLSIQVRSEKNVVNLLRSPSNTPHQLKQIHAHLLQTTHFSYSLFHCNSLLFAYAASPTPAHAFLFFSTQMDHLRPNNFTFLSLLKASSRLRFLPHTSQIHAIAFKLGFGSYTFLQNAVLHSYAMGGCLSDARKVFDEMLNRDTVSFNSMIRGYCELGEMVTAFQLFLSTPEPNVITWTALVVGYSGNGDIASARWVFDRMPNRDLVSWNAMISSYVQNRRAVEALDLFQRMQAENFVPNPVTIVSALCACATAGALEAGKWIHAFLHRKKIGIDPFLGTALIDMYSKCGAIELASEVFESLPERNSCTWNAMINGLAVNGQAAKALHLFRDMQADTGARPDELTFVGVLLACSHGGFLEEGRKYFYCTLREYGVEPLVEHYACIVDLLGRYGHLKEAKLVIRNMLIEPDIVVWRALLGGCRLHRDIEMAEWVVSKMEARDSGDYVLLSNLYASSGRWTDVERVRTMMKDKRIRKVPGSSSIVVDNTIHEFISGDKSHPSYMEIYNKLQELGREMARVGYLVETVMVFYDIEEEEKEQSVGHHSEKLAIAFGLISTGADTTIRIVKNLRVCSDCHNFTKLISKICNREIVVRDRIRFHHFKDGECSCKDYW